MNEQEGRLVGEECGQAVWSEDAKDVNFFVQG